MAGITQYNVDKITKGTNAFGTLFCNKIFSATLAANADTAIAVPSAAAIGTYSANSKNRFIAVITSTPGDDVFMAVNVAAAVPAGAAFAASSSELIPNGHTAKSCLTGDTLHFISTGTPSVTVAFYAIQDV
jgi:hypothetical protein